MITCYHQHLLKIVRLNILGECVFVNLLIIRGVIGFLAVEVYMEEGLGCGIGGGSALVLWWRTGGGG